MTRKEAIKILSDESLSSVCEAIDFAIDSFLTNGPRKAKWINPSQNPEFKNKELFNDCSRCGFTTMDKSNYCPYCGFKMEG